MTTYRKYPLAFKLLLLSFLAVLLLPTIFLWGVGIAVLLWPPRLEGLWLGFLLFFVASLYPLVAYAAFGINLERYAASRVSRWVWWGLVTGLLLSVPLIIAAIVFFEGEGSDFELFFTGVPPVLGVAICYLLMRRYRANSTTEVSDAMPVL